LDQQSKYVIRAPALRAEKVALNWVT